MFQVHTIDCHYLQPEFAASFLLENGKHACFIENNTSHAVPFLLQALKEKNLKPEAVEWIIVTHAHLDHAGGTAALLAHCPNATVLAHPKAAKTLMDPSKLLASAKKVYGEEAFLKLYGEILPISPSRVRAMADNEELEWHGLKLNFLHTLGHATHHFCIHEVTSKIIFTGDAFGIRYPQISESFIFPSTSPIDFEPIEAKKSVLRIANCGAETAYLTHFGRVTNLSQAAKDLTKDLDFHEKVLNEAKTSPLTGRELTAFCEKQIRDYFYAQAKLRGVPDTDKDREVLELDITINAQGIAFVAEKSRKQTK